MARAIWRGAVSFGLVNIPVNLHPAVRDSRPHFRLLHAKDHSPVRFERVCRKEEVPVRWNDVVKGYEYEKGKFVVFTKKDFEKAALEKSQTIDILHFVDAEEIDERFFETPYFLTPNKGGERAYVLLREAIHQSGRVGIAKIIMRETQHLAALIAHGKALLLTIMRFPDELLDSADLDALGSPKVRPQELTMAKSLVENLTEPWKPDRYTDEYRANLMRIIKAKVKGTAPKLQGPEAGPQEAEVVDLMSRLRQSLEARQSPREKRPSSRAKKTKTSHKAARRVA
ncbi:MAG TPA: Ku protein [Nitrospiraceae bacterium]|nr:Ku protein [Nitrospiraceae bacterium]